jgi:hypothetical protein
MVVVGGKTLHIFESSEKIILNYDFSDYDFVFPKLTGSNHAGYWGYSRTKGLLYIDVSGKLTHYNFNLPSKTNTSDLFMDRENNLWFITDAGLLKFNSFNALSYLFNESSPGGASILQDGKQKYLTNGRSLFSFSNGKLKRIEEFKQSGNLGILFRDSHNNYWVGQWSEDQGVWKARLNDGKKIEQVLYKQYDHEIISAFAIQEDEIGTIWIGGGTGIFLYKNGRITQHYKLKLEGRSEPILALTLDKQKKCAWVGTNGLGLIKIQYSVGNGGNYSFEISDKIDQEDGLKDPHIRGNLMLDAKGKLWIGSRSAGLGYLVQKENKYSIKYLPEKEGIGCGRISSIKEYNNFIWVSTCDGVYKIEDSVIVKKYNSAHGFLENDVLDFMINNEELVAVTSEGVTQVKLVDDYFPVPSVVISEIKIAGIADSSLYKSGVTYLPDGKNSIGFTFTANSFIDERKVLYKHKLEGFDKDWSLPGPSNTIDYASLAPGNYNFKVIAQNAKGIWSKVPVVYSFHVTEPFYKSTWFAMAIVFTLLVITDLIRSYRMKQQNKIQALRQSIARDLHDDIGSALGSINILSKTVQRRIKGDTNTEYVISKIGTTAQKTLESMDEIIWTINPSKEKVIDLLVRMQNFAQPLLESEGIQFNLVSNAPDLHKLEMKVKRNFYLIFKELIYNAIRHARCTIIDVNVYKQNKLLVLEIKDDGIGINGAEYSDRNGLKNIKDRVSSIGGKLIITSENGKGTTCIVKSG